MRIANGLLSLGEVNEASDFTINNSCGDFLAEHVTSGIIAQEPGPGGCGDDWYMVSMNRDGSEARTLEIGIANDGDDHINLQPTGNVGINERNPQARLHVNGNVRINDGSEGAGRVLTSDDSGNASWVNASQEAADEFSASAGQVDFSLSQFPAAGSKVKMFVNGIRISNNAYSIDGSTVSYNAANNGGYVLSDGDRIQFDFTY